MNDYFENNPFENKSNDNSALNFKKILFKYFSFWKIFLLSFLFFSFCTYFFLRYTDEIFQTEAVIKILDKKESNLELPSAEDIFNNSKINLENEVEILKSYPILSKVIKNLNLTTKIYAEGEIMSTLTIDYPFLLEKNKNFSIVDSNSVSYNLELEGDNLEVTVIDNHNNEDFYVFKTSDFISGNDLLPFNIINLNSNIWNDFNHKSYLVKIFSQKKIVYELKNNIKVEKIGKESDLLKIIYNSSNVKLAENIINELINTFNDDGVRDRQLIHKRTVDFVSSRFAYLTLELDSIELMKESFMTKNNLVNLSANSAISLEGSVKSKENIFDVENQITLTDMLILDLNSPEIELLPSKIGIGDEQINFLISSYNENVLKRKKIILSAGKNNPSVKELEKIIKSLKENVLISLKNYSFQQIKFKEKLNEKSEIFVNQINRIPQSEKILREIERNQKIKESLYLFLMQKREEAIVSYAVTEPSIKIVEKALTSQNKFYPNVALVVLISLLISLGFPFLIIYLMFFVNSKIQSRDDLELVINKQSFLGEVPQVNNITNINLLSNLTDRDVLIESFRVIASNIRYLVDENKKGNVIYVSSSIKSEGKTFTSIQSSIVLSSYGKKVLLVGSDLRNPQIHSYFNENKSKSGLSNYLINPKFNWRDFLVKDEKFKDLDVLLSGPIAPNPFQLLNNGNLEKFIADAKKDYDYIIFDHAPTLLVADCISVSKHADAFVYCTRCNISDIELVNYINDLIESGKIKNVGFVLNGVGAKNKYGYSYQYGYGYGYKYSYNYGYGYGYNESED